MNIHRLLSMSLLFPIVMQATENPFKPCEDNLCRSDYSKAISCYDRMFPSVIGASNESRTRALVNWGEALLGEGNYIEGWTKRDARLEQYPTKLVRPWDGSNPYGKTILIRCEGGFGDTFFFARYVSLLHDFGARTIVLTQNPLKSLMTLCPYIDQTVNGKDPMPAFDYDVYMMSLPLYLAHNQCTNRALLTTTTLDTIANIGQYMFADPRLVSQWKAKLPCDKFKIGICWKASALPAGVVRKLERDIPLELIAQIGKISNVALYNLFDGKSITDQNGVQINGFGDDFDKSAGAFMDTAAVIQNMDLILSVDTAVPNLAGAMFKRTWILLPYESDWRWGNGQPSVSPWHPTARLFWQPNQGNWIPVMEKVMQELIVLIQKRG